MSAEEKIAVLGGCGLYQMEGLADLEERRVQTPFGQPSDTLLLGTWEGVRVVFLPRHGKGHLISPSEIPNRANIYALKTLGVERVISVSAVGSLKEELRPLDMVVPDQIIDCTKGRPGTFFGDSLAVHVGFAEPFCPVLSGILYRASEEVVGQGAHEGGTYIVIEGPAFSTRAESELYRSWGASVIGMTALPEAKLAREAEMCYSVLACVTDYDCWHPEHASVSVEMVIANLQRNVKDARAILRLAISRISEDRKCGCATALKYAIATSPGHISQKARQDLGIFIGKYLNN